MKRLWLAALVGGLALAEPGWAANVPEGAAGPDLAAPLRETVAALAEKAKRPAGDYARLAEQTIGFGSQAEAVAQLNEAAAEGSDPHGPWRNMVNDGLAGVAEGRRIDPKAADWDGLEEQLKKMQPPPPPPSQEGSKKDKQDQKNQKKDKKQQKGSGKDKQQPSGGGQKSEKKDESGGEGAEGEGESEGPPSLGQPGKGDKKGGQKGGGSDEGGEGENQGQKKASRGKDPNQIREFDTSKDGEGQMKERGRDEEMKGMEDEKAGFGSLGQEKKEGKEQAGSMAGREGGEDVPEAPPGMRVVGGGSGKKGNEKSSDPMTLEAMSRLDQVRQSDSPAILQQRLQPKDQMPQPSSLGKPW
jgi:hypothetical protein